MVGYEEGRGCIPQTNAGKATNLPSQGGEAVDGPFTVCPAIPSPTIWARLTTDCGPLG